MNRQLDAPRWVTIFSTLSLDLTRDYISLMGLDIPDLDGFVASLRETILEYRSTEGQSQAPTIPFSERAFERFRQQFGRPFSDYLYQWGTNVFQYSGQDGANAFLWRMLVIYSGSVDSGALKTPDFIEQVRSALDLHEEPVVPRHAHTSWDRTIFERQRYDDQLNPAEFITSTIRHFRFVCDWNATAKRMNVPAEGNHEISVWGTAFAPFVGLDPSRLGPPGQWPPLPVSWRAASREAP